MRESHGGAFVDTAICAYVARLRARVGAWAAKGALTLTGRVGSEECATAMSVKVGERLMFDRTKMETGVQGLPLHAGHLLGIYMRLPLTIPPKEGHVEERR